MLSKPAKPRAIATQLVLLFTTSATLLLLGGLGVFAWIVVQHAYEEDRAVLADKVSALKTELKANGPSALKNELETTYAGNRAVYLARLINDKGTILAQSPNMPPTLTVEVFPSPLDRPPIPRDYRSGKKLFSLVSIPAKSGPETYTLQVAQDRSVDNEFAREFGGLLAIIILGGVLASALIAVTVTKRVLRPLSEMTLSLQRAGPTHLHERVAPAGWPRELQPLALAFDDMLDRLEASFTRLSQFSADLAHELRTPVANILGESEVALTRPRSAQEYHDVIESSISECKRISGIVDNLLFLARSDAAEDQLERTLFDGRSALEKIASFHEVIAEEQGVTIVCEGDAELYANSILFSRAISNLVENSLRFTPSGGTIRLYLTSSSNHTEVAVADNGSGIEASHLPKIFDRFYRVDPSRSSGGTGLGLSLVKSIAQLHRGEVSVRSEFGRGTTITLIFPKAAG
jgi:two-component system heavy metal sensor histidine kinase CusS